MTYFDEYADALGPPDDLPGSSDPCEFQVFDSDELHTVSAQHFQSLIQEGLRLGIMQHEALEASRTLCAAILRPLVSECDPKVIALARAADALLRGLVDRERKVQDV